MRKSHLIKLARPYGVKGIHFGGCIESQAKGFTGAMRRKAHAHCYKKYTNFYGWICVLSPNPEKRIIKNGKPSRLFWHEVGHIFRPSWTEKQCDSWAWSQIREQAKPKTRIDVILEKILS